MRPEDCIARYCAVLSDLRADRLNEVAELCDENIVFKDPFNETAGLEGYLRVLEKMFADLGHHRFRVIDRAAGSDRHYLRWVFEGRLKAGGSALRIEGMTELAVSADGLIARHVDYWDVGRDFYERLPLLGALIAWVRRRAAA